MICFFKLEIFQSYVQFSHGILILIDKASFLFFSTSSIWCHMTVGYYKPMYRIYLIIYVNVVY